MSKDNKIAPHNATLRNSEGFDAATETVAATMTAEKMVDNSQTSTAFSPATEEEHHARFVLQIVQPALLGLMDGSVSTLAPLFATAGLTHDANKAFFVGLAASVGAGISMGLAEALSDDGSVTGRGNPWWRGVITGAATILGGMLHTLPFLIPNLTVALHAAYVVVVLELFAIAYIRFRYMKSPLGQTIVQVILGGGLVFAIGLWLGSLGAGG